MVSIGKFEDEIQILGKYGMVSWMGDYWDVWITGVHLDKELSSRKVKHLCERIKPLAKSIDTGLTCEATAVWRVTRKPIYVPFYWGLERSVLIVLKPLQGTSRI